MATFKGIKQVTKTFFDGVPSSERIGALWFVNDNNKFSIYLGNRQYADVCDTDAIDGLTTKLGSLITSTGSIVDENGTWVGLPDASYISGATDLTTALSALDQQLTALVEADEGAFHFRGTKDSVGELPADASNGDVWIVGESEYAWNGTEWVELGSVVDLSGYVTLTAFNELAERVTNIETVLTIDGDDVVIETVEQ